MAVSLMVGIPTLEGWARQKTAESLGNAIEHLTANHGEEVSRIVHRYPRGYDIDRARNFMAQWALDEKCDYLFMVDSDIILPQDAISNLLQHRAMVCLGWYARTTDESFTNVVRKATAGHGDCFSVKELASMDGTIEVKAGGMGCALVSTDVFGRIKFPWFEYTDGPAAMSEDYSFCKKCWEAGIGVLLDARVGCGHIKERVLEAR